MESRRISLKLRTHNINGFDSSREFLYDECEENSFSVLAIQEHWLRPSYLKLKGVNRLKTLHPEYDAYATSGMSDQIHQRVMRGRPYGGTGFLFKKDLMNSICAKVDLKHERVTIMELCTRTEKILLMNAYFPFFDSNNIHVQLDKYRDTIAFISNVMASHCHHKFILFADLNCDIFSPSHPFTELITSMMTEFDLIPCFDFINNFNPKQEYTRFDTKRNSYTLIDGILLSSSLGNYVESCSIVHPAINASDHLPIDLTINVEVDHFVPSQKHVSNYIPWSSLTDADQIQFRETMFSELSNISVPYHALNHCSKLCDSYECTLALETFYKDILSAVMKADQCLPRRRHGISKPFWSPELTALKQRSIDSCKLWKECNCPRSGPIFEEKTRCSLQYKAQLRKSKNELNNDLSSRMNCDLISKDTTTFWKRWNQLNGKTNPPSTMIDGFVDYDHISSTFSNRYSSVYKPTRSNEILKERFNEMFQSYRDDHIHDNIDSFLFTWSDMIDAVFSLKTGKATSTPLKAEHVFLGCPELTCYFHLLFNGLLSHSYLPYEFLCGTISPVLKDPNGDTTDSANYRPVTLGPIISQLFEYALFNKFRNYLVSDDLQFGFKKSHSASHAIFVLKSCVDYYTSHGSNVYVSFLDCSKAFDTISHFGIYIKLMERKVPLCFLKLIIYLYSNLKSRCMWRGSASEYFDVPSGMKQGGIISPRIFSIYMDDLVVRLRERGIGCHYINLFIAAILYADDICLMAPSRGAMQDMINICQEYCKEYCLSFNVNKSKILLFGNFKGSEIADIVIDGKTVDVVDEWKYLGVTVMAGPKISFSHKPALASFYRSANSVLTSLRRPNELVLMNLLYTNCVPCLSYAAEVVEYRGSDMNSLNVALNDAIRRIYSYNRWESTRSLRQHLGFPNISEIFHARKNSFLAKNVVIRNEVIRTLTSFVSSNFYLDN